MDKRPTLDQYRMRLTVQAAIRVSRPEMPDNPAVETRQVTIPACQHHGGIDKLTLML